MRLPGCSLWYLQAYLADLSSNPSSPSFELCKRLLNKSQAIVFSEDEDDSSSTSESNHQQQQQIVSTQKVRENVLPALVGMGAMLLGIGQPLMTKPAGRIAIAQGRRNRALSITSQAQPETVEVNNRRMTTDSSPSPTTHSSPSSLEYTNLQQQQQQQFISASQPELQITKKKRSSHFNPFTSSPSLEDLHKGKAFSVSRYIKNAHHKLNRKMIQLGEEPNLLSKKETNSTGEKKKHFNESISVFDPKLTALGQSSVPTNTAPLSPALSECCSSSEEEMLTTTNGKKNLRLSTKLSTSFESYDSDQSISNDDDDDDDDDDDENEKEIRNSLSKMSIDNRKLLLRSNYFRSEMQFLLALVDIANRLVIVPKEARMSALHAELTLLNHNLPAEVCLPLWCPATCEKPYHHRIVRISPSDAVVLNSAERAPYLLMIEVLDDEMSFEDDAYTSALYRMRQSLKHKKSKRQSMTTIIKTSSSGSTETSSSDIGLHNNKTTTAVVEKELPVLEHLSHSNSRRNSRSADNYAERMRTAAVMLAQLQLPAATNVTAVTPKSKQGTEQIRQRIIKEMIALEEQRMTKMKTEGVGSGVGGGGGEGAGGDMLEDEQRIAWVVNKEDPSAAVLSEDWETKKARLRAASPYGHLPNWRLISVIVKNGADLRQEQFAIQLIREFQRIWEDTGVNVWVKYFRVLVTSDGSGLIETLRNTISIHSIKKDAYTRGWNEKGAVFTLYDYFEKVFGSPDSDEFIKAQDAFMRSLAGYSVACYVLQIKDRHNGNLLIDESGHLIHIDFGFMLSNSPGSVGFEMAPFKLPQEYIDILGGVHGEKFAEYKALMKAAFLAVRKHSENILLLTEMMSKDSKLPCFQNGDLTVPQLRDRFQLGLTEPQAEEFVDKLIMSSCCNVFTRLYDTFQYYSQGIL
ncbi:kinase-like domain-containing protein [Pilaira anomala]|nr:kinase-like domain-containing protein [Pilaira anomala]